MRRVSRSPAGTAASRAVESRRPSPSARRQHRISCWASRSINDQDRAYYDALVVALRRDSRRHQVVDWWGTGPSRGRPRRRPSRGDSATLGGMVRRRKPEESTAAVPSIVTQLHPRRFARIHRSGATIVDRFAAIDRQTQLITAKTTIVVLLILLLIVYRSAIRDVPSLSVVVSLVAKRVVSVLSTAFHRDIPVFPRT